MVWMEVSDQQIFDLFERNPFALQYTQKFLKRPGPAAVNQELAAFCFDDVIVR